jgi:hypothetical protein
MQSVQRARLRYRPRIVSSGTSPESTLTRQAEPAAWPDVRLDGVVDGLAGSWAHVIDRNRACDLSAGHALLSG